MDRHAQEMDGDAKSTLVGFLSVTAARRVGRGKIMGTVEPCTA